MPHLIGRISSLTGPGPNETPDPPTQLPSLCSATAAYSVASFARHFAAFSGSPQASKRSASDSIIRSVSEWSALSARRGIVSSGPSKKQADDPGAEGKSGEAWGCVGGRGGGQGRGQAKTWAPPLITWPNALWSAATWSSSRLLVSTHARAEAPSRRAASGSPRS